VGARALPVGGSAPHAEDASRPLRDAVAFLTRIPVASDRPLTARALSRAAFWFPAVGLLVGGVMGGTYLLAEAVGLPAGPATVLALLAAVLVTGGLHEDGLADVADATCAPASGAWRSCATRASAPTERWRPAWRCCSPTARS
jgi:hypothetical protein